MSQRSAKTVTMLDTLPVVGEEYYCTCKTSGNKPMCTNANNRPVKQFCTMRITGVEVTAVNYVWCDGANTDDCSEELEHWRQAERELVVSTRRKP